MILKVLNEVKESKGERKVSDVLFPLQFIKKVNEKQSYELSYKNFQDRSLYEYGLKELQSVDPALEFLSSEYYLEATKTPPTREETDKIILAKEKQASEECRIM